MAKNEYRKLVAYALDLGLEDAGYAGTGHHLFRNPATGETTSLSTHIASRSRAIENARAEFRRVAGISGQGRAHVDGERKKRKPRGPMSSGFNLERAVRELKRTPKRDTGPTREELAAERESLISQLIDMAERGRPSKEAERMAARVIELDQLLDN